MGTVPAELWDYEEDLQRYARYLCHRAEDAEDVAHNALLKAAEHFDGFRGEATLRSWLHTIVTNECRMLRRRTTSLSLDRLLEETGQEAPAADLSGKQPDPADVADESELRSLALSTLRTMPDQYRTALFLQLALRNSIDEIALALGKTVPATKSILYRARAHMRDGLATHLDRNSRTG